MAVILLSNLDWETDVVTEISRGLTSSLQRKSVMVPGLVIDCLLPNSFQSLIHHSSCH
jgi:hypothetical protein